jgi:hypothetical protein
MLKALREAVYKPDDVPKSGLNPETPVWSTLNYDTCDTELFDHSEAKHFRKRGREGFDAERSAVGTNISILERILYELIILMMV